MRAAPAGSGAGQQSGRPSGVDRSGNIDSPRAMPGPMSNERAQMRSEFSRELGLSSAQERQLEQIRDRQRDEIQSVNQSRELTADQRRDRVAATLQKYDGEARAILNREQRQQLDQTREKERLAYRTMEESSLTERLQSRAQWRQELSLSPSQQAQLEQIRTREHAEVQAAMQDWDMSQEQRRDRINSTLRDCDAEARALLTRDQRRALDQLRDKDRDQDRLNAPAAK
jgi:hypothetical protein